MTEAMDHAELDVEALERPLFANYGRAPIAFESGSGARLRAVGGKTYLDFLAGIATCSLGHAHPGLVRALQEQAARLLHVSNLFQVPEQSEAATLLTAASDGVFQRAFFCNSGAEANEAMLKLARLWGHEQGALQDRCRRRCLSWPHFGRPRRHRHARVSGWLRAAATRV